MSALSTPAADALTNRFMNVSAAPSQVGRFSAPSPGVSPQQQLVSKAPAHQHVTPLATTKTASASPDSVVVDVPVTLSWSADGSSSQRSSLSAKVAKSAKSRTSETKAKVLAEVKPLGQVLQAKGLATSGGFNVSKMYLSKATNFSSEPVAIKVSGTNGANLEHVVHTAVGGDWSTISLMPGETLDLTAHNGGLGRQLVDNPLSADESVTVKFTAKQLMSFARPSEHYPGKSKVRVNLSKFYDETGLVNSEGNAHLEADPLGWVVYGNAMPKFAEIPSIEQSIRGPLPGYSVTAKQSELLPDITISQESLAPPGTYEVLVPDEHLEALVERFGMDKIAPATKTKAKEHTLSLIHSEGSPKSGGVVRAHFTYVIDHNGAKYNQSEEAN
jgi:hypothetical protein